MYTQPVWSLETHKKDAVMRLPTAPGKSPVGRDKEPALILRHSPDAVIRAPLVRCSAQVAHLMPHVRQRLRCHQRYILVH